MMVAVAILAVASSAMFFSNSEALNAQARMEEQTVAQWALANQVAYYQLAQRLDNEAVHAYANSSLTPQQVNVGGYDLEITTTELPTNSSAVRHIEWQAYRIVDGDQIGPIRTLTAWVHEEP